MLFTHNHSIYCELNSEHFENVSDLQHNTAWTTCMYFCAAEALSTLLEDWPPLKKWNTYYVHLPLWPPHLYF